MTYQTLTHSQAMDFLSQEPRWVVLDVRDSEAYSQSHVPNALHLSVDQLSVFCKQHEKNQPILLERY